MTQYSKIINTLYKGGSITSKKARRMGIKNLRARVCEMRNQGHLIISHLTLNKGSRVEAEYRFFQRNDYFR